MLGGAPPRAVGFRLHRVWPVPFPPRTPISDAIATMIRNAMLGIAGPVAHLPAAAPSGGVNRCMCTVVTTGDSGDPVGLPSSVVIAISGPNAVQGGFRTAINNLFGHGHYRGVSYAVVGWSGRNRMTRDEFNNPPLPADPAMPWFTTQNKDCAEPKALEEAARRGERPAGMSTFWWGNVVNAYPDPPGAVTHWAVPCPICATNEKWIMKRVEEELLASRGAPRRAFDV